MNKVPVRSEVPVIDIGAMVESGSDAAVAAVASQIRVAALGTGFFYVSNHGVPADAVADVFEANRRFHALPIEEKLKIKRNLWHRGYEALGSSTLKSSARFEAARKPSQLESISIRHELDLGHPDYERKPLQGPNQWPADPWFKQVVQRYDTDVRQLGLKLLHPFAMAVGEKRDYFDRFFSPPTTNLRVIHYPPAAPMREEDTYGINPHTDYGFMTILAQDDVGGLQVRRVDGTWIDARYIPGTFIINVGDVLARWTNDVFNSTPHRVISPTHSRDRYSVGHFFDPNIDALIECLPSFQGQGKPVRHESIRYGDYFAMRLDANHPDRVGAPKAAEAPTY